MTVTLYDCATAPSPRRARILLAEKGVAHDTVQIDLRQGEHFSEAFRRINPQCTVPALVTEEGPVLTDNAAIAAYLEARYPEPPLQGITPLERPRWRTGTGVPSSRACWRLPRRCATAHRPWPTAPCPARSTTRRSPPWPSVASPGCSSFWPT